MTYRGRIEHGVVVLNPPAVIAEGTEVEVLPVEPASARPVGAALEQLAGAAQGLPADLAERHDHYRRERAK